MTDQPEITKAEFVARFVDHCRSECGFTHFDDGVSVVEYAGQIAETYWADPDQRNHGPEDCAEGEMDCWGED